MFSTNKIINVQNCLTSGGGRGGQCAIFPNDLPLCNTDCSFLKQLINNQGTRNALLLWNEEVYLDPEVRSSGRVRHAAFYHSA